MMVIVRSVALTEPAAGVFVKLGCMAVPPTEPLVARACGARGAITDDPREGFETAEAASCGL